MAYEQRGTVCRYAGKDYVYCLQYKLVEDYSEIKKSGNEKTPTTLRTNEER